MELCTGFQAGNRQVNGHNWGLPNTQKSYLTQKFLESWKRTLGKPHMHLFCSSAPRSASALGHWDRTVGQAPLWPDLGCSACTLAGPRFSQGLCRVCRHPAPGLLGASPLLSSHPPPLWWTHPRCSSCVYFQSRPKEWFLNRSIHSILLLGPYFQDKRAGNGWGAAGILPPLKVCHRCLGSRNESGWKGNTTGPPACTAPGDWAESLQIDDRSEI